MFSMFYLLPLLLLFLDEGLGGETFTLSTLNWNRGGK